MAFCEFSGSIDFSWSIETVVTDFMPAAARCSERYALGGNPRIQRFLFFPVHLLQRLRPKIRKRNKTNYIQIFEQSDLGMARKKHKFVYLVLLIANKTVTCLSVSCGIFAFDRVEMEKNGV